MHVGLAALAAALLAGAALVTTPSASASPDERQHTPRYDDVVDVTLPVDGWFTDDYDAGRAGGRIHRATDLFAEMGTPVRAAMGGVVVWAPASEHATAGFALQVRGDDGRLYAYYHLGPADGTRAQALANGIDDGVRVERGQVIGWLGNSGNARTTPPHLHFEIHDPAVTDPYGTQRMNPFPSLAAAAEGVDVDDRPPPAPAPTAPPEPPPPSTAGGDDVARYTVLPGDTLSAIAELHGIDDWRRLVAANPDIEDPDLIWPGQVMVLYRFVLYAVEEGDTLSAISELYGLDDWQRLVAINPHVEDPDLILPGQEIRVPEEPSADGS